jgi:hypothetical protein
MGKTILFMLN